MMRRLVCAVLCLILLAACGKGPSSSPGGSASGSKALAVLPMDFSVKEQHGVEFQYANAEDSIFTMLYEPVADANAQAAIGLCIPEGYDSDPTGETETTVDYAIYDSKTHEICATVTVQTAPPDPAAYFGVETQEEILHAMQSSYFTTERFYNGLRKNIVEDFQYELAVDWTGTSYGLPTYYLEYLDTDKGTQSMRFYFCDDEMNENFYSFRFAADVPIGDEAMLNQMRAVLFSLHSLGSGGVLRMEDAVTIPN